MGHAAFTFKREVMGRKTATKLSERWLLEILKHHRPIFGRGFIQLCISQMKKVR